MTDSHSPLRLNVGFIIHQTIGYSRDFPFDVPQYYLPPDLQVKDLVGVSRVTRTPQGLLVQTTSDARTITACVRCLTDIEQPLHIDFTELYAFSQRFVTDSGLIVPDDGHIDLTPLIREYMLLAMPISPLCRPDCKGLCPICGENQNEVICNHEEDVEDSRFSALKALLE